MLIEDNLPEEAKEAINVIYKAAKRRLNKLQNETVAYNFFMILLNATKGELPTVVTGFSFNRIHLRMASALLKKERPDVRVVIDYHAKKVRLSLKNN